MEENPIEYNNRTDDEDKHENIPRRIKWVEIPSGNYTLTKIEFPSGKQYAYETYTTELYYHLHKDRPLADILEYDDLVTMFGASTHGYQDVTWLEFAKKYYPENFEKILVLFENSIRNRKIESVLSDLSITDTNKFYDNDETCWFDDLKDGKFSQEDPDMIRKIAEIFLKYAPPVGSNRGVDVEDFLGPNYSESQFVNFIPHIGEGAQKVRDEVVKDRVSFFKSSLSLLPAYNAGKKAHWIGKFVKINKDKLNEAELIDIVNSNVRIGSFDKKPILEAIHKAYL